MILLVKGPKHVVRHVLWEKFGHPPAHKGLVGTGWEEIHMWHVPDESAYFAQSLDFVKFRRDVPDGAILTYTFDWERKAAQC